MLQIRHPTVVPFPGKIIAAPLALAHFGPSARNSAPLMQVVGKAPCTGRMGGPAYPLSAVLRPRPISRLALTAGLPLCHFIG
jgi:hypothetical protein